MNVPKLRFPEFSGEWEEKKLSDIASYSTSRGKCFEKNYVTTENMNKNYCGVSFNNSETVKDGIAFSENDILFANIRPYLKKVWLSDRNGCVNSDVLVFHISNCSPNFINNIFCSDIFLSHVMNGVKGIKMPRGDKNQILEFNLKISSLLEQQKIADFLSTVDSIIASETKILNALQKRKKALMQKLFSQQLRFKADDGSEFPEWVEKKLEDLCTVNQGLQIAIEDRLKEQEENSYFYITNEFIKTGTKYKYYIINPPKTVICNEDDILMTRTGNTGIVVTTIAGCFHNNFFKINYDRKFIVKQFFVQFFKLPETKHRILVLAGLSTIQDLNHKDFYSLRINLPCKEEQQKIADCLSSLDNLIQNQQKIVTNWQQRKKGLLQQMFI